MLRRMSFADKAAAVVAGPPTRATTMCWAGMYVFSGVCQPLIMTLCRNAGLGDSTAQLYMFFYYLGGPALLLSLVNRNYVWPPGGIIMKAVGIAVLDIFSQALNYTGAGLAGPTVFAIVYSSVTIWTAVFSRVFLHRTMTAGQWLAVLVVFGGLTITASDSIHLGPNVRRGTAFVVIGSMIHGSAYVFSEAIMKVTADKLTVRQNAGVQGTVACVALGLWQVVYTLPRWDELIAEPAREAGTSVASALAVLLTFSMANVVHSLTFGHTLKYCPGGATSAGVMKGLQAVLVFLAAHVLYCGRVGGEEMCFTLPKLLSLFTVTGGVALFGIITERLHSRGYTSIDEEQFEDEDGVESVVLTVMKSSEEKEQEHLLQQQQQQQQKGQSRG